MKWNHLPSEGGMLDQKAGLMDRFFDIFMALEEQEEKAERERKKEMERKTPTRRR